MSTPEFKQYPATSRQQITATLEARERTAASQDTADLSPLAAAFLEGFPALLNPEIAERLADIADAHHHYRCARVHSEP